MKSLQLLPRAGYRSATPFSIPRVIAVGLTCAVLLHSAPPIVVAAARYWAPNAGGAFDSNANWSTSFSGTTGGATPPGAADTANFNKAVPLTIGLSSNVTNSGLSIVSNTVTLDLNSNVYTVTGANGIQVGTSAVAAKLAVKDGTLAVDDATDVIFVGVGGGTGSLTISALGQLGTAGIRPNLSVGRLGSGSFSIEDNGRADLGYLVVGALEGATGASSVSGPHAVLNATGAVFIGQAGNGTLEVKNGGRMTSADTVRLGFDVGSAGTAQISGVSSLWTQANGMTLGSAGNASLTIDSGGTLQTIGGVAIGNLATSTATAAVTGSDSTWTIDGALNIGNQGLGNFLVTSGGRSVVSGNVQMSVSSGSTSNVFVDGAASRWTTGALTVGNAGTANFRITGGAVVQTYGNATIASGASSNGKVVVSGSGSSLNITGAMNIAGAGSGAVTVDSDALLTVGGALTVASPAGAPVGELNFNGGTITAGSFTRAAGANFNWTNGTLLVNGGTFSNAGESLTINGSGLNDLPALRLSAGAQSTIARVPSLTIGSSRRGAAIVSGGSLFQLTSASIGSLDGGTGSLVVEGTNSTFSTTADLSVGGTANAGGGLGSITLGSGGSVNAGGALRLWNGASVTLSGGTLRFNNLITNGGRLTFNSGTVQTLSAFNANSAALDAIVGSTRILGFGRKIDSQNFSFNLQSDLSVTGGVASGGALTVSSGVVARFEAAATGTFTSVVNPSGARIYVSDATLSAGSTFTNSGEVHLSGEAATINGTGFTNTGLLSGSGRINAPVANNTAGQVRVADGQRLEVLGSSGANVNNGLIDVHGGTIEFGRVVTNSSSSPSSGLIAARDATLRFEAGLSNSGALTFSSGVSDVFGNVTNLNNLSTPGRIVVTGGAQANFFDDVVNNGSIQVSGAGSLQSTAVFLGSLSGNGVSGGGHVFIEGDARPGFSPGTMSFGGDVSFGPLSTLNIELAGANPGTQYDRVVVADSATIGGDLEVTLLGGYRPTIGTTFQILSAAGGLAGTFAAESLPELAGGASWSVQYGSTTVTLEVGGVLGDFNHDGRVDAADYTVWRDQVGTNALAADASGNGSIDQADYNIWKANFGKLAGAGAASQNPAAAAAVPEPTSYALVAFLGACLSLLPRRTG